MVFFWGGAGVYISENQAEFEILTPRGAGCFYYVVVQGGADSAPPHNPY